MSRIATESHVPVLRIADARARIRALARASGEVLVVMDDDPTGTQVAHGLDVYLSWSEETLCQAFRGTEGAFFLSTNTRGLSGTSARALVYEAASMLSAASRRAGRTLRVASRSDSTLRGHYAEETEALAAGLKTTIDGILVAPAFFEGGRFTREDTQWVVQGDSATPAHLTEYAQDPVFGFHTAHLPTWISEKTGGIVRPEDVLSISLRDLREGGPQVVRDKLLRVRQACPVVVNAVCYEDLEVMVLGLQEAEAAGKRFLYRCAASFVKVRAGLDDRPLLTAKELGELGGRSGLVVAGSFTGKTTRQIERLLACRGTTGIEMRVASLVSPSRRDDELRRVAIELQDALDAGNTPVLYTSRERRPSEGEAFLRSGARIMDALCRVVRDLDRRLAYVIAKGGITSHAVARHALAAERARVLGQVAVGVPVWRLGPESRRPGTILVVFPGNVGEDETLAEVWRVLSQGECS